MMRLTKAEVRDCIAALRPPAQAFERAKANGFVVLDEQLGFIDLCGMPRPPANPDQLTLDR